MVVGPSQMFDLFRQARAEHEKNGGLNCDRISWCIQDLPARTGSSVSLAKKQSEEHHSRANYRR